jgi:hypothetical protein
MMLSRAAGLSGVRALKGQTSTQLPTLSGIPAQLTVTGRVTSGTAGFAIPAGLRITLHVAHPMEATLAGAALPIEASTREGTLSTENAFRFEGVSARPGDSIFVTADYQGALQGSPVVQLGGEKAALDLTVVLYAPTSDSAGVSLIRVQHILEPKPGNVLQVLSSYYFKNVGDRFYLSGEKTARGTPISVSIPLPIGARGIAFNPSPLPRFAVGYTKGNSNAPVVQDTKAVLPGQIHEVVFSYQLPFNNAALIDQDYPYFTESVEILVPSDVKARIADAERFSTAINTTMNPQRPFLQYGLTAPLKAGERLAFTLESGIPPTPSSPVPQQSGSDLGTGMGATLALAGVLLLLLFGGIVLARRLSPHRTR